MKKLPDASLPMPRYQSKRQRKPHPGKTLVHLHWLWKKGPAELRGVKTAVALCGAKELPRAFVTSHREDATCHQCTERANA